MVYLVFGVNVMENNVIKLIKVKNQNNFKCIKENCNNKSYILAQVIIDNKVLKYYFCKKHFEELEKSIIR